MGTINQDAISWAYYDGLGPCEAHSLASHLTHGLAFDKFSLDFHMHYQQNEPFTCSTIALLHLQQALGRADQLQSSDILNLHFQLLQSHTTRPLFFGLGPSISEMTQQLITILESKGVSADQSQSRAQQVQSGSEHAEDHATPRLTLRALRTCQPQGGHQVRRRHYDQRQEEAPERQKAASFCHTDRPRQP